MLAGAVSDNSVCNMVAQTTLTAGALLRNAEAAPSKVTLVIMCTGKAQMCGTAVAVRRGEACTEL